MAAQLFKWFVVFGLWFPAALPVKAGNSLPVVIVKPVFHPFYIAVTEVEHNAKEKTLEISCKLFAEDFEEILKKNYKTVLDLSAEKDKAALAKYIPDYINQHLQLSVDGQPVKLSFIGYEKDKESAFCYFQADGVAFPKKIDIQNSLLHDFIQSQINIIHVVVNGKRQSTKLDYPASKTSFTF